MLFSQAYLLLKDVLLRFNNYNLFNYRNKLASWISQCSENHYGKSGATATRLREQGNLKFKGRDNDGSLRLYTEVLNIYLSLRKKQIIKIVK